MNPEQQPTNTPPTPSTEQWFENTPAPNIPGQERPGGSSSKKKWWIIGILLIVLLVSGGLAFMLLNSNRPSLTSNLTGPCLTKQSYESFTDRPIDNQLFSEDELYTSLLVFQPATANTSSGENEKELQNVVNFYKKNSSSSIVITIASDYYLPKDTKDAALSRIKTISDSLQKADIPSASITTEEPEALEAEDSSSIELVRSTASVSIASSEQCQGQ